MKTTILTLFLTAMTGLSMVALPPAGGTDELAAIERANRITVEWANYYGCVAEFVSYPFRKQSPRRPIDLVNQDTKSQTSLLR